MWVNQSSRPRSARLECKLSPAELVDWVLEEGQIDPPVGSVADLAQLLGIDRVEVNDMLTKAGCLEVSGGDLVIQVRPGKSQWQRFTLAHELGHYLLAVHQGIPLAKQVGDRRVERYCNSFASHLLLPREWIRSVADGASPSLDVVLSIASLANCTAATALVAINDALEWGATLAIWRRMTGDWTVQSCIRPYPTVCMEPTFSSARVLASARSTTTRSVLPVLADKRLAVLDAELRRSGGAVLVFSRSITGIDDKASGQPSDAGFATPNPRSIDLNA